MKIKRNARRNGAGILLLILLVVAALTWRGSWIINQLLRSWIDTATREASGDIYSVAVGDVDFSFTRRRVTVDGIRVTTKDSLIGTARRPRLTFGFSGCRISGVHLATLVRGRGLIADAFTCQAVTARVVVPAGPPDTTVTSPGAPGAVRLLQQRVQLPSFAPRVQIERIDFPEVALDFQVKHTRASDSRVQLKRFQWHMAGFAIDSTDARNALRPMFSHSIDFEADSIVINPDSIKVIRFASVSGSLTDSTIEARGFSSAPVLGRDAFAAARPYRRKYEATRIGNLSARGVNVGKLLLGEGLRARTATVDSLFMEIINDHRKPMKPGPLPKRRTPQQWIADVDRPINIDSLFVRHSQVVYRLRNEGRDDFGIIRFARINALALDVNTSARDAAKRAPMRLAFSSWFQDSALLKAYIVMPLRSRGFDMTYRGTLGPMSADHLNQFVEATTPIQIVRGDVTGLEFSARVSNGVTQGTITPIYNGFTFKVKREGSKGLAGRGGMLGNLARSVATFAGNWNKIHPENPGDPRNKPRVGKIHYEFKSFEALPDYLWYGLRDGIMAVVRR